MTLNLTASTLRYVCQVSDRRLIRVTQDGKTELYTDHANKSTLLSCNDASLTVSYNGIGEDLLSATRTDLWLVKALQKSNPAKNPIGKVLEEFKEQSSEWINNLRRNTQSNDELYRHTFVFAGYVGVIVPVIFYVSNFEDLKTNQELLHPLPEFVCTFSRPIPGSKNPCSLHAGGVYNALNKDDIDLFSDVIQKPGAQPKDVINIMVRVIQKVSEKSTLVGKNCMSA